MTTTTQFATAKDVSTAIHSLGLQTTADALGAISRTCRDEFLEHLSACIAGQDTDAAHRKAVELLLRCLSPKCVGQLHAIVPNVPFDAIVPFARKAPNRFLSGLEAASNPDHPRHQDAKNMLLTAFGGANSNQASAPVQTRSRQDTPSASGSSPAAQAGEGRQAANTDKSYESCHVYGGSFALCFNADNWDGSPGIMVDAAAATGPKSYDWKNAIHIWLNAKEIGAVLAVFRRWRKSVEFSAHGAQNDKSFSIEFQGKHFFAKVSARKAATHPVRAVQILPTDATSVSILFLKTLAAAYSDIPLPEVLETLRTAHLQDHVSA